MLLTKMMKILGPPGFIYFLTGTGSGIPWNLPHRWIVADWINALDSYSLTRDYRLQTTDASLSYKAPHDLVTVFSLSHLFSASSALSQLH